MTWARSIRVGKSGAKLVLLVLADRASPEGVVHDCTQIDIAEEAELTDRQVRQLLNYLEQDAKIIDRERRAGDGRGRQNDIITLAMSRTPVIVGAKRRQPENTSASPNRKILPQKNLPVGATGNLPQTPSKILPLQKGTLKGTPKGSPSADCFEAFEALWELWRSKDLIRRAKRKPAFEAFQRLVRGGADPRRILAGARAYLADPRKTEKGGEYMPDLFRWLRDEVWADWLEEADAARARAIRIYREHGFWDPANGDPPDTDPQPDLLSQGGKR